MSDIQQILVPDVGGDEVEVVDSWRGMTDRYDPWKSLIKNSFAILDDVDDDVDDDDVDDVDDDDDGVLGVCGEKGEEANKDSIFWLPLSGFNSSSSSSSSSLL
mgnify:CR=1 FL=1